MTSSLKELIQARAEFWANYDPVTDWAKGSASENSRLAPLISALASVVLAGQRMRAGNGFRGEHTEDQADNFDDAIEALTNLLTREGKT